VVEPEKADQRMGKHKPPVGGDFSSFCSKDDISQHSSTRHAGSEIRI